MILILIILMIIAITICTATTTNNHDNTHHNNTITNNHTTTTTTTTNDNNTNNTNTNTNTNTNEAALRDSHFTYPGVLVQVVVRSSSCVCNSIIANSNSILSIIRSSSSCSPRSTAGRRATWLLLYYTYNIYVIRHMCIYIYINNSLSLYICI